MDGISNEWPYIISRVVNLPAKNKVWSVVQRLVLGAAVYYIWQERNIRRMQFMERSCECLVKIVIKSVRMKLMGLSLKMSANVVNMSSIWNLPIDKTVYHSRMVEELCQNI